MGEERAKAKAKAKAWEEVEVWEGAEAETWGEVEAVLEFLNAVGGAEEALVGRSQLIEMLI